MDKREYQIKVAPLSNFHGLRQASLGEYRNTQAELTQVALGLVTEYEEVEELLGQNGASRSRILEEFGDFFFYITEGFTVLDISVDTLSDPLGPAMTVTASRVLHIKSLRRDTLKFADLVKKKFFGYAPITDEQFKYALIACWANGWRLARRQGIDMGAVFDINFAKVTKWRAEHGH